jgi:beta-aspartyl-dipeptidase (metallo-type)
VKELTVLANADVYSPEPLGSTNVVFAGGEVLHIGKFDFAALEKLGPIVAHVDCKGMVVTPGFIDPHEHLIGGSGEEGFSTQTPEIFFSEIVSAGITTVVGCLGVDSSSRTLRALIAKVKGLKQQGISAFLYSGGYDVPAKTLFGSVRDDMLFIEEVIGAGEIAISDLRSTQPSATEIARLVADAYCGGILTGKAGVTHFHVGPGEDRLHLLREVLDGFEMEPASIYPTHIERSEKLVDEAVALAKRGCTVDIDTFDEDLTKWLPYYWNAGGPEDHVTVSSDAAINSPRTLLEQFRRCISDLKSPIPKVLRAFTSNTAQVLKMKRKGRIAAGCDADLLVFDADSLDLQRVYAGGKLLFADGAMIRHEDFLAKSNRRITLHGHKD